MTIYDYLDTLGKIHLTFQDSVCGIGITLVAMRWWFPADSRKTGIKKRKRRHAVNQCRGNVSLSSICSRSYADHVGTVTQSSRKIHY